MVVEGGANTIPLQRMRKTWGFCRLLLLTTTAFGRMMVMMMISTMKTPTKNHLLLATSAFILPPPAFLRRKNHHRFFLGARQQRQEHVFFSTTTHGTTTATTSSSTFNDRNDADDSHEPLLASRLGLDPMQNRFHAPIVYHERYSFADWPPHHTFPMNKFERIAHALQTTCKKNNTATVVSNLSRPIVRSPDDYFRPLDLAQIPIHDWLSSIMDADFVHRFLQGQLTPLEIKSIGFGTEQTHRPELVERTVLEVAGTILTCQLARRHGIASNVAGGTHHAHPNGGAGYTIFNDLAVAANVLLTTRLNSIRNSVLHRVLVIDCDVHQGDGTAQFSNIIPGLFTLSLHCESNYPTPKIAKSTFDVGIRDGCRDDEYLDVLQTSVNHAIATTRPDFVLYDAGVDIYEHDRLGRLHISEDGIRQRDRFVLDRCVAAGIPVAAVVGGGYDRDVDALARRHAIVHEECAYVWRKYSMWKEKR
jgi:acetoin utilization deacetylase AcuC-like enzyme